jgi:pyruvate/2-oxoglutarate/acetoin dehydrogenase E1 component
VSFKIDQRHRLSVALVDDDPVMYLKAKLSFRATSARLPFTAAERENMKIAQVAPLMESVPPRLYGDTERVVSYLTDELVRLGHEVTLFASGDSVSTANLVRCVPAALRLDANVRDPIPYYMLMLDRVRELADEFEGSAHGRACTRNVSAGAIP